MVKQSSQVNHLPISPKKASNDPSYIHSDWADAALVEVSQDVPRDKEQWRGKWRPDITRAEKAARKDWVAEKQGRSGLRIIIVAGNFLPKIDGVTMTISKLLYHLKEEGHECMVLCPESGMVS